MAEFPYIESDQNSYLMSRYLTQIEPDCTYHVYSRSNGDEVLFSSDDNHHFFLELFNKYIHPLATTFCYCLMPNHFHFLIRINSEKQLYTLFEGKKKGLASSKHNLPSLISKQFSNLFNAYSKAYNKQQGRHGSLFERPFKRKKIETEEHLIILTHYIHYNPVEAGLALSPEDYKFSSYNAFLHSKPTRLETNEVISWFGDIQNFIYCHQHPPKLTGVE